MVNHRRWLENFKMEIETAKKIEADQILNEELKRLKVKQEADRVREMIRKGDGQPEAVYNPVEEPTQELTKPVGPVLGLRKNNEEIKKKEKEDKRPRVRIVEPEMEKKLKKKKMPAWAKTSEEVQKEEVEDDEKLLDFMDSLDVEQYLEDLEFKTMLNTLKKRVSDLKGEPDWREKWKSRLKEKTEKRKKEYLEQKEKNKIVNPARDDDDDNLSVMGARSVFSDAGRSIASSKTHGKKFSFIFFQNFFPKNKLKFLRVYYEHKR